MLIILRTNQNKLVSNGSTSDIIRRFRASGSPGLGDRDLWS